MLRKTVFAILCAGLISSAAIAQKKTPVITATSYSLKTPVTGCSPQLIVLKTGKNATLKVGGKSYPGKLQRSTENEGWTYFLNLMRNGKRETVLCTFSKDGACGSVRLQLNRMRLDECPTTTEFLLETCK